MLKLIFCLHRLPSLSREAFQQYWWETHGPLVRRHAAALGIRRYVQSHALGGDLDAALRASRGGPEGYDGVAELWWDDAASFAAASASEAGRIASRELLEDERRFIDHSRSPLFVVEEREPLAS
jgi:uncharacterized protein (TIGR02118 family)